MKRIVLTVSNDLSTDQRVRRHATTLARRGAKVKVIGRYRFFSKRVCWRGVKIRKIPMLFGKGPLFYAEFNASLFLRLLLTRTDAILANDLDTLPAAYYAAKIKGCELIYDSHEYFTGVPELANNGFARTVWIWFEKRIVPHLKKMFTVNESIAGLYHDQYGIDVGVVRNLPETSGAGEVVSRQVLGLPEGPLLIMQGAWINRDRGGEELVQAMAHVEGVSLVIIGGGDVFSDLKKLISKLDLSSKVIIKGKMDYVELAAYTRAADIGVTLDKDTNINYRFSLPNKLFDYIQAGIAVLASPLPEVKNIVDSYDVGHTVTSHDPAQIAEAIKDMCADADRLGRWKANARTAAKELNWENESATFLSYFPDISSSSPNL